MVLVPVDGHGTAVAAEGGLDGPAPTGTDGPGGTAPGPDAVDRRGRQYPDAAPSTPGIDAAGGAGGSSGGPDAASDVLPAPSDAPSAIDPRISVLGWQRPVLLASAQTLFVVTRTALAAMPAHRRSPASPPAPAPLSSAARMPTTSARTRRPPRSAATTATCARCRGLPQREHQPSSALTPRAMGSVYTPVSTCDGKGACVAVKTQDCAPFLCAQTGCSKTCTTAADCDSTTSYCDTVAKTCAAKLSNGKTRVLWLPVHLWRGGRTACAATRRALGARHAQEP